MADNNAINLTILLLGAFWAGTSALFTGMEATSKARDKIVTGLAEKTPLSIQHRRQVLYFDWLPLKLSLASASLVLGFIIWNLPSLSTAIGSRQFSTVCMVGACVPFAGAITFLITGLIEWRLMSRLMQSQLKEKEQYERTKDAETD